MTGLDRRWPLSFGWARTGPIRLVNPYLTIAGLLALPSSENIGPRGLVLGKAHRFLAFPSGGLPTIPTPLDSQRVMDRGGQ